jgi:hypothetical protein
VTTVNGNLFDTPDPFFNKKKNSLISFCLTDVTKMLLFAAQASHELLPPDVLESVVSAIVNNFVTERNSAEVMAVG